ncbi:glycosyltransferase family 2 protein [Rhodococcus jostii]|uniref:Glycosyltransferase, GT2 family n=1 Tax=Rhodococcus jostii TaxID=132919 RepID=A0A1H5HGE8_RHOJO|nr:glycosyltransferase family 2 protein [Rhodococcus jostii]SEE26824.1 Glycosyltransferase, GT2 family [Rhodococcus jostii]
MSAPDEARGDKCTISVVIVTYNSAAVIEHCLAALGSDPALDIIVVDNDSIDDTIVRVSDVCPHARVIRSEANVGFAGGVNRGVSEARGDHVLLLNPDAVVDAESVFALSRVLDSDDSIGVVAPLLDKPGERLAIRECGRQPDLWRVLCHYSGLSRFAGYSPSVEGLYLLKRHSSADSRDVDWVSGACMLVRRDTWMRLDGLSRRWFMYAEDIEFCLRVKESGERVVTVPAVTGVHLIGESSTTPTVSQAPNSTVSRAPNSTVSRAPNSTVSQAPNSTVSQAPNSAWVVNMYDLYKWRISRTRLQNIGWKWAVAGGLFARSAAYRLRATQSTDQENDWGAESVKFRVFARDLLAVSSARVTSAGESRGSR